MNKVAIQLNYAVRMIRNLKGYRFNPCAFTDLREIATIHPTMEECKVKLTEIETYLEQNPELVSRFDSVKDACGCTGRLFLNTAKNLIR